MSVRKRTWITRLGESKEAWIVDYSDQSGVRRQKTFGKKKEADAWRDATRVAVRDGTHVADSASVTVTEAGNLWITTAEAAKLERTTIEQYRQHLALHIAPLIGGLKLSQLNAPTVRNFEDKLRSAGRSDAMVRYVVRSLGSLLADAQERGMIVRNPVRELRGRRRRGKGQKARHKVKVKVGVHIPTPDEIKRIVAAASGRWRPLLLMAIFAGLRSSELRGLRWSDVDLPGSKVHVRQRADRYRKIGSPKSKAGERTVPLPPIAVNTMREWKLACPKTEGDLCFPTDVLNRKGRPGGQPQYHVNIIKRGLIPTMIAAGVVTKGGKARYPGLHALRHFYASWCINRKDDGGLELPAKVVQERMGHSSIMVTLDTYGHLFETDPTKLATELAAAERKLLG